MTLKAKESKEVMNEDFYGDWCKLFHHVGLEKRGWKLGDGRRNRVAIDHPVFLNGYSQRQMN